MDIYVDICIYMYIFITLFPNNTCPKNIHTQKYIHFLSKTKKRDRYKKKITILFEFVVHQLEEKTLSILYICIYSF